MSRTYSSQSQPRVRPGEHTHWLFHLGEQFGTIEQSKLITHNFPPKYISNRKECVPLPKHTYYRLATASFMVLQNGKISASVVIIYYRIILSSENHDLQNHGSGSWNRTVSESQVQNACPVFPFTLRSRTGKLIYSTTWQGFDSKQRNFLAENKIKLFQS